MWIEDKYEEIKKDPEKSARLFKFVWISSYFMLILGGIIIVAALILSN